MKEVRHCVFYLLLIPDPSGADVILNRTEKIYADNIELTSRSLNELREQFAYDFDESHYISEIIDPSSMIQMDLGYQLPFFGARYRFANVRYDCKNIHHIAEVYSCL